jgi:hypothetical protein
MAMVYVGDVYSLVAQEGFSEEVKPEAPKDDEKDDDGVLPFIR